MFCVGRVVVVVLVVVVVFVVVVLVCVYDVFRRRRLRPSCTK